MKNNLKLKRSDIFMDWISGIDSSFGKEEITIFWK